MKLDLSKQRLMSLAEKSLNEDRLYDALRWANKADNLYGVKNTYDYESFLADVYEHAGVVDGAIQHWFYALDLANKFEVGEVYESLAFCFENKGDKSTASFYYNKAMKSPSFDENMFEVVEEPVAPPKRQIFRRVFPYEKADFSQEIMSALDEMRKGEFAKAEEKLEEIPTVSKDYRKAGNFLAISKLMQGKAEEAVAVSEELYRKFPKDSEIIVTLATAYKADEQIEKGIALARELKQRTDLSNDEMFKVAALLCELELHAEAYEYTCMLDKYMPFDGNLLFMSGCAAINSGNYEAGLAVFDKLVIMYPDAYVVRFYQKLYQSGSRARMTYLYRLPEEDRKARENYLNDLMTIDIRDAELEYECSQNEIDEIMYWCFDEMDGQDIRLQAFAISVAIRLKAYEFLQDILMNYQVDDVIKVEIVRELCSKNVTRDFRVVVYNLFQNLHLRKLSIGRKARKKFLDGYAECVAQFGLRIEDMMNILPDKAEELYRTLEAKEKLDEIKNEQTVAVALCYLSGIRKEKEVVRMLAMILDADPDDVLRLLEVCYE